MKRAGVILVMANGKACFVFNRVESSRNALNVCQNRKRLDGSILLKRII